MEQERHTFPESPLKIHVMMNLQVNLSSYTKDTGHDEPAGKFILLH
jgi:hypothetical protein